MSFNSKNELHILIATKTRDHLIYLWGAKYKDLYPSFSVYVEEVLLSGIERFEND